LAADELLTGSVADVFRAGGVELGAADALAKDFRVVCLGRLILFDRATHPSCRVHHTHTERDREGAPDSKLSHEGPPSR
jgi:hypothetical protein